MGNSESNVEKTLSAQKPGGTLNTNNYHFVAEEQKIYQHLLHLVKIESPEQLIERFRTLFFQGADYPEPEILSILDTITALETATENFPFFLNRCCHILINHLHIQPQTHRFITDLINLFESSPTKSRVHSSRNREISRLHELIKLFVASEQYLILRRFTQVVNKNPVLDNNKEPQPLMNLIRRYPYLYEHCLVSEESTFEQQETVRNFQLQVQKKFEVDLSQYLIYKVRRIKSLKKVSADEANRILRPVDNPTLLNDSELYSTLKQFIGKAENGITYDELAQKFLKHTSHATKFSNFKDDLYEYLITSVDGKYGKHQFNQRLYTHLKNTLSQADSDQLSDFLIMRTCSQLLNFLVINSPASPQHFTFLDLISNQGNLPVIGMLLKVVLICRKLKPYLEKRFAILFNHYESFTTDSISWLVGILEQLNIALSIHFGNIDLSFFKNFC